MLKLFKSVAFMLFMISSPVSAKEIERVTTTSPELTLTNLNSQIETLEALLSKNPGRANFRSALFDLISTRAQFAGSYSDFDRLNKLSSEFPDNEEGLLIKARYYSTVHEFKKVLDLLSGLDNLNPEVRSLRIRTKLALREDLENLKKEQLEILSSNKNYSNYMLLAEIESELGNFSKADEYFEESFKSYSDSSPLPLAYMYFRRGVMWSEKADDSVRGLEYYNEAVHYLPQFVNAQVHRAEIISSNGDTQGAILSLSSIVNSEDPEPRGLLAELYLLTGKQNEANNLIKSATDSYSNFLKNYPLAFADHASEFYSGVGSNFELAYDLAIINLTNRKTERSFIVALEAAIKANRNDNLCRLISEAKAIVPVYNNLLNLIDEKEESCSKT